MTSGMMEGYTHSMKFKKNIIGLILVDNTLSSWFDWWDAEFLLGLWTEGIGTMFIAVDWTICGPKGPLTHTIPQYGVGEGGGNQKNEEKIKKINVCSQNADCKALICNHLL